MNAKIGDVDVAYDRQGEGEQVLLVMGLGAPRIGWFHQVNTLSQDYDVCVFDNRGVGETVHPGGSWTIQDMVADAIGLADAIGFERFHLVGISMGGMISQEIALAHPERLRSLTLMATTPAGPESVPMTAEYAAALTISDPHERMRRTIELTFGDEFRKHNPEMIDLILDVQAGGTVQMLGAPVDGTSGSAVMLGFLGQVTAVGQWFVSGGSYARLGEIHVPTLVMHGGDDKLIPVANGELLARKIRGAQLREWPLAGHALNVEYPDEVNATLMAHMQSASARV